MQTEASIRLFLVGRLLQMFKAAFEVGAWRASCEAAAGGIKGLLSSYKEVLDHLSEGLRFYMSLQVCQELLTLTQLYLMCRCCC
jgi:hypothetical protein